MEKGKDRMREMAGKRDGGKRFGSMAGVFLMFVLLAGFLLAERSGIRYQAEGQTQAYLPQGQPGQMKFSGDEAWCLLLVNSEEAASAAAEVQYRQIFQDMRIAYDRVDVSAEGLPELADYETVAVVMTDLAEMGEDVLKLGRWVEDGGRLLFGLPLQKSGTVQLIAGKLGILEFGDSYANVPDITFTPGFLLGGEEVFAITDPYESAMQVQLDTDCQVYGTTGDGRVPILWSREYGKGKFVVTNFGYCEKAYRGIYGAAYTLLEDVSIYPVINGSAFYIDDFPSPVPSGDGEYIRRDYEMSVEEFYSVVWWPDMMANARKYGLRYTGMIIENYENQVSGELPRNKDTARYNYFGNMLLEMGGELGFHGYNHRPLCLENFVYPVDLGYKKWESWEEMSRSVWELNAFSQDLFPDAEFSVYVPPSNVLSPEGRQMLAEEFPQIRTIASIYLPGEGAYEQEFQVSEDSIVETPRVISGCALDEYMKLAAFSELNFHLVNSHFLHPDDLLDEDRGAALGWEALNQQWNQYLDWLYQAAPSIRNLTGSQLAGAVQRYCGVSLWRLVEETELYLTVDGLQDEAYFMLRANEGSLGEVSGGELTHMTGDLYLLRALEPEIVIQRNR